MIGILFDLDGTLLDTLEDIRDADNYALRQFGYPEKTLEEVRRVVGNGAAFQVRGCLPEGTPESVVQEILEVYRPYYTAHCRIKTAPYAGVLEQLKKLQEKYPVAIVSNKPDSAVKALCADYFPGMYALGESDACPRKPAADMVFAAMKELGIEQCIYVGDTEVDVQTAKNAGIPCLCVLWGFRDKEELEAAGGIHFCETTDKLHDKIEEMIHGK